MRHSQRNITKNEAFLLDDDIFYNFYIFVPSNLEILSFELSLTPPSTSVRVTSRKISTFYHVPIKYVPI